MSRTQLSRDVSNLTEAQPDLAMESRSWYALKVRSGGEQTTKRTLEATGYQSLLPTYVESRRYSDRIKKLDAPLFSGYVFCRFEIHRRLPVLTTPGVQYVVGFGGIPQAISAAEITALETLMHSGLSGQPWPYLRAGEVVSIQHGALAGLKGILVRMRGADKLVLSVDLLQRSVAVEIDRAWVRPARAQ